MFLVSFDHSSLIHASTLNYGKLQQYYCFCGVEEGCFLCSAHWLSVITLTMPVITNTQNEIILHPGT